MSEKEPPEQLAEELKAFPAFAGLPEDQLVWLASQGELLNAEANQILFTEGSPANFMTILLDGEFRAQAERDPTDAKVYISRKGDVSGKLPYSRMTELPVTVRSTAPSRLLLIRTDVFPEMIQRMPVLIEWLVGMMSDRIRYTTREDEQREKLIALGKLSAGLAHELNNPAAAAKRAALALSEAHQQLREANAKLDAHSLTEDQRKSVPHFERQALQAAAASPVLDPLTESEEEEKISEWLKKNGQSWKFASTLAEAGIGLEWLNSLQQCTGREAFPDALARIASQISSIRLLKEIESSTGRISELVKAVKTYSFMDQAPVQEVDVHQGLDATLVMLRYKLGKGVEVIRNYRADLPLIQVFGSELNQVWTNLIDNAADAMKGTGKLSVRTSVERDMLLVEIEDSGPGIPREIQPHIFEPFFTTKKVGEGTGLGLDLVYRIVRKHGGSIRMDSKPGSTRFQVRLPISR